MRNGHESTREAVMEFLPAQFPWIDLKDLEVILSIQRFSIWPNTEKIS